MSKHIIVVLLAVMMLVCFIGCSDQTKEEGSSTSVSPSNTASESTEETEEPASGMNEPGVLPIVNEVTPLTLGVTASSKVSSYEDCYWHEYVLEQTNIDLQFITFPEEEPNTKFSLMVSAGEELPDVYLTASFTSSEILNYGANGTFIDCMEYFEDGSAYYFYQAENFTESDYESIFQRLTSADGCFYGYPRYNSSLGGIPQFDWCVNVEWLDYLGLDMPETLDDFTNMLIAFRDGDPNQNGIADEIPYYDNPQWNGQTQYQLINLFVYYDPYYHFNVTDGQLWVPYVTDEFRDACEYLNMLVSEGLMSSYSFTTSTGDSVKLTVDQDGTDIVGLIGGYYAWSYTDESALFDYDYLPLPEGPSGVKWSPNRIATCGLCGFITSSCEDPDLAFHYLDFHASNYFTLRYGEEGVDWYSADSEGFDEQFPYLCALGQMYDAVPTHAFINDVWSAANTEATSKVLQIDYPVLISGLSIAGQCYKEPSYATRSELIENNASVSAYIDYLYWTNGPDKTGLIPDEVVYNLIYTEEETENISEIGKTIESYVKECVAQFAVGNMDIDKDWDSFVQSLYDMGLQEYIDVSQTAYERMMAE